MKFFISCTTALILSYLFFLTATSAIGGYLKYVVKPETGSIEHLHLYISLFALTCIIMIILFIVFFFKRNLDLSVILFSSVVGVWVTEFVEVLLFSRKNTSVWVESEFLNLLPIILFAVSYFIMRNKRSFLHIELFASGLVLGLITSYGLVILLRSLNNSLTSYFNLRGEEVLILLVGTLLGSLVGNFLFRRKPSPDSTD